MRRLFTAAMLIWVLAACNLERTEEETILTPAYGGQTGSLTIESARDISLEIEGAELAEEAGSLNNRGTALLVLAARLHNQADRPQCVTAREVRLYIDGREYAPQDVATVEIGSPLRPQREIIGTLFGQCVAADSSEPTFLVFSVPKRVFNVAVSFAGHTEPVPPGLVADIMMPTATPLLPTWTFTPLPSTATPSQTPMGLASPTPVAVYYTTGNARARSCPGTSCAVRIMFPEGTVLYMTGTVEGEVVEGSPTWMETIYDGREVYIHSSLLADRPPSQASPTATRAAESR